MDPHAVNAMGIQGNISMPMSMAMGGVNGSNPQAIAMGINGGMAMNAYGVPQQQQPQQQEQQQQQMMMNMGQMHQMSMGPMPMKMNANAMNVAAPLAATIGPGLQTAGAQRAGADWRIQLTREHRANLIAKIYNEMVRVSADPVPGIKLWMNVSWYELTLYKESRTQEEYINKIFTRLKSLRAQQTDMNAVMAAQMLPNQGMLSRLDFSYYNTLNMNHRASVSGANGSQVGGFPGHAQFGRPVAHPGAQQPQPQLGKPSSEGEMPANLAAPNGASTTPRAEKSEGAIAGDTPAQYWRQHAALKLKYHDDVEKVHSAFKKYVDHMKGHNETEQKKKLRYLLSYVQLCASILNENKTTHAPRKIEELDKVYKYIVKIVNPYLKKLRTETDKRSFTSNAGGDPAGMNPSMATNPESSPSASAGAAAASANTSSGPNGAMQQQLGPPQPPQNISLQQKQQQYLMQQRVQQQQQRIQVQARQQQMMQQQHMMQQQQKNPTQQNHAQLSTQQANQANMQKRQQNGQHQQNPQQNQEQLAQHTQHDQQASNGQQRPAQVQQPALQQPQQPRQPSQPSQLTMQQQHQTRSQQHKIQQPQQQQAPPSAATSRAEASSLSLDDPLYGGMDGSSLLLMPSNLGASGSSSGFMNFPNDLSPTNFSSMDLLDMDGFMGHDGTSSSSGSSGQNNSNGSGRNNTSSGDGGDSDLMFMEAL